MTASNAFFTMELLNWFRIKVYIRESKCLYFCNKRFSECLQNFSVRNLQLINQLKFDSFSSVRRTITNPFYFRQQSSCVIRLTNPLVRKHNFGIVLITNCKWVKTVIGKSLSLGRSSLCSRDYVKGIIKHFQLKAENDEYLFLAPLTQPV